jgi:two-component system, NtrC family, response regulator HydG
MSPARPLVFVVEDEPPAVRVLTLALEEEGFRVESVGDGAAALERLSSGECDPDAVILDHQLPGMNGLDVLRLLQRRLPELPVVTVTAHGDERLAVEAMRLGAFAYLPKPLNFDEVGLVVRRATELRRLRRDLRQARIGGCGEELIGESDAMRRVRETIADVAPTNAVVLILGETGTGKELVARAIHAASRRARARFVAVNAAAFPETLLEAELFGHVKGAFTGAVRQRDGRFLSASGGTLFLDEIGDLPLVVQPKLLRVLEAGEVTPLGADLPQQVDVRLVAATHRRLRQDVEQGRFREDLFYRLNVVPIELPPLRDRRDDIPQLVAHMLPRLAERHGKVIRDVDARVVDWLSHQAWQGNVRELQHTLERLVVLNRDGILRAPQGAVTPDLIAPFHEEKRQVVEAFERDYLRAALEACRGHLGETARRTGISPRQLYNLLHKYDLASGDDLPDEPEA